MNTKPVTKAFRAYRNLCESFGTDVVTEEQAILSVDRKFLPACALEVLDHGTDAATVEYYAFLTEQTTKAQNEHDAEYAAGREALS